MYLCVQLQQGEEKNGSEDLALVITLGDVRWNSEDGEYHVDLPRPENLVMEAGSF
jgi:hypothetical protein